jgi:hypothetical protein
MMAITNYAFYEPSLPLRKRILLLLGVMVSDMGMVILLIGTDTPLGFASPLVLYAFIVVVFSFSVCIYHLQIERRELEKAQQYLYTMDLKRLKSILAISKSSIFHIAYFSTFGNGAKIKPSESSLLLIASRLTLIVFSLFGLVAPGVMAGKPISLLLLTIGLVAGNICSARFRQEVYREWEDCLTQTQQEISTVLTPLAENIGIEPTYDALEVYVKQTFTPGMSRSEVLKKLEQLGTYRLYDSPAGYPVGKGKWLEKAIFQTATPDGAYPVIAFIFVYTTDESLLEASLEKSYVTS